MKKWFVGCIVIPAAALSAPVRAADMPPVPMAPIPIALPFDWEGFYLGVHTGAARARSSFSQTDLSWNNLLIVSPSDLVTGESGEFRATWVLGGLQAGYNWVLPGPYLFGLEADISGTDVSSTVTTSPLGHPQAVAQWNDKMNSFGSVRARLGYIAGPWLFYETGGFGWDYDKVTRTQLWAPSRDTAPFVNIHAAPPGSMATASRFRAGWTIGAGVEWAFARTWTAKLEYLHFQTQSELMVQSFSDVRSVLVHPTSTVTATLGDLTVDTVRLGLNYTFN